jgi:hypothetical protein
MKNIILFILILLLQKGYCQTWNGLPIYGSYANIKIKLQEKGYSFINKKGNVAEFSGTLNGTKIELFVIITPKTSQVTTFNIYFPKQYNWYGIKTEYNYWKDMLNTKYSNPDSYENFIDPYYEGDGYEMSAITIEKCNYGTFWMNQPNNLNVSLQISKYQQVKLSYENKANVDLFKKEQNQLNQNIL